MESLLMGALLSLFLKKVTFCRLGWDGIPSSRSPFLEKDQFLNVKMRAYHLQLISFSFGWIESLLVDPLLSLPLKKATFER
jgi:hypothetical protein